MLAYAPVVLRRFGENLKKIRIGRGIRQAALARLLDLKTQGQISLWETGDIVPTPETIKRIAAALNCETWELLEGVETEYDRLRQKPVDRRSRKIAGS